MSECTKNKQEEPPKEPPKANPYQHCEPPTDLPPGEDLGKGGGGASLENRLQNLQAQLRASEVRIEQSTKAKSSINDDIKALMTISGDLAKTLTDYSQSHASAKQEYAALQKYEEDMSQLVKCALGDKTQAEIDAVVHAYKKVGVDLGGKEAEAHRKYKAAETAYANAKDAEGLQRKAYEYYKGYAKHVSDGLKVLKEWKKQIDDAHAKHWPANMDLLLRCFLRCDLRNLKVLTKEELEASLTKAWQALDQAKTETRKKEQEMFDMKADHQQAWKAWTEHKDHRQANLLREVKKFNDPCYQTPDGGGQPKKDGAQAA